MNAEHRPMTDNHPQRVSDGLLQALRRWREADGFGATEPFVPGLRVVDADRALMERAKGALMLRYGIDSHQALAVLIRWSRVTRTPVTVIADTLMHGICEGNPETEIRKRALVRWLEHQLRDGDPDVADLADPTDPTASTASTGAGGPAPETPPFKPG